MCIRDRFIEGVIVEKNERFFTIETDIQEKIVCTLPKEYDYQDISPVSYTHLTFIKIFFVVFQ